MKTSSRQPPREREPAADTRREVTPSRLARLGFPSGIAVLREELLVVGVMAVVVTWIYKLYNAHWRVPFSYSGDGLAMDAYAKAMSEHGWYLSNPRLAAPFHADWRDFPLGGENIHYAAVKVLGLVSGNWATGLNLYFVLGFFLIATSAYFVARYLDFGVATSLVVAVLYTFLPYHAYRGAAQMTRSAYYVVPVAVLVILWMTDYRRELLADAGHGIRFRRGRLIFAVGFGVVLGASDTQNSMFMVSILAVICVVSALRDRDWRPLALLALIACATFGSLVVNNTPYLVVRHDRGVDRAVANRTLFEQELYGLRPSRLVLPATGHRIPALRHLTAKAKASTTAGGETAGTALGIVGAIGFLFGVGALLSLAGTKRGSPPELLARLGLLNVVAVLVGTVGGFAFLLALGGLDLWRTWNRISTFIAYSSLLGTAILLEWLWAAVRRRAPDQNVALGVMVVAVVVVIVGGVLDQTPPSAVPAYQQTASTFDRDATFYHRVEQALPRDAMVFQLPLSWFPEQGPIANMPDYTEFAAYIHTSHLRWSYGGIRGRIENTWQADLAGERPAQFVATVAAVGFDGLVLDTRGYADGGAHFLQGATPVFGKPVIVTGPLQFYDLRTLRERLARAVGKDGVATAADIALDRTEQWQGFSFTQGACTGVSRWATSKRSRLVLVNSTHRAITTAISASLTANRLAQSLAISGPGFSQTVTLANGTGTFARSVTLPPGASNVDFRLDGPAVVAPNDPRHPVWQLTNYTLGARFDSAALAWAMAHDPTCAVATPK
jgi:phosphoglycerol transferase